MKAVLRELAQARRHYSRLPLFEFLRGETLAPRDRLAFLPCIAPFVLALPDVHRFVLRDENSRDPHQQLVNLHTRDEAHRWAWYLDDLARLGFDRNTQLTQLLRSQMKDETQQNRMLMARLCQLLHGATPTEKLVALAVIQDACAVFFEITGSLATRIQSDGGPDLRWLGQARTGRAVPGLDPRALESIALTELARVRCLDLGFRLYDLFADWSTELLACARNALTQRTTPQLVHGRTA